jgi:hypothetical protein
MRIFKAAGLHRNIEHTLNDTDFMFVVVVTERQQKILINHARKDELEHRNI